jgi:hypothetical protein
MHHPACPLDSGGLVEHSASHRKRAHRRYTLNCHFRPIEYACRDTATGALYPVPPDQSRAERFCPSCEAAICLLDRDRSLRRRHPGRSANNRAFLKSCRRAGTNSRGLPLARRCWNCAHLRHVPYVVHEAYVCRWLLDGASTEEVILAARSRKTMMTRLPSTPIVGCGGAGFRLRRGPIEEWDVLARAA